LLVVIGIVIYNYFFGTPEEQESSKQVFAKSKEAFVKVKDVGKDVFILLSSEKQKFDAGKYDVAIQKMGTILTDLKSVAKDNNNLGFLQKIAALELKKEALSKKVQQGEDQGLDTANQKSPDKLQQAAQINKEIQALNEEVNQLIQQMDSTITKEEN
jgi:nucleoside-triphosphatase THEP1